MRYIILVMECFQRFQRCKFGQFGQSVYGYLQKMSYFSCHAAYFCFISLFGGILLYYLEGKRHHFTNTLFLAVSAVSETGLISVDLSDVNLSSQIVLLFLILSGSVLFFSIWPPLIRMWYFDNAIKKHVVGREQIHALREHRALSQIVRIVLIYCFSVQAISFISLGIYCSKVKSVRTFLAGRGLHPWWFALFHSVSTFNNCGMTLLSDNMCGFAKDRFILLVSATNILLGNCASPVVLRFIVWIKHKIDPSDEGLTLLLHHPRYSPHILLNKIDENNLVLGQVLLHTPFWTRSNLDAHILGVHVYSS